MTINFKVNDNKALEAIVYIVSKVPGLSHGHVGKCLFYAEKEHLNRFGRPIIGDTYIKMEKGPVPSRIRYMLLGDRCLPASLLDRIACSIHIKPHDIPEYLEVFSRREPNLDVFSLSDLKAIDAAIEKYSEEPWDKLSDGTHELREWLEAEDNRPMDFEKFIDADNPNREEILASSEEHSEYGAL